VPSFLSQPLETLHRKYILLESSYSSSPKCSLTTRQTSSTESRDRHQSIVPYATNRILLSSQTYINASPITVGKEKYIATQGPMEETVREFWEMVWQERSPCIIMLCKPFEEGTEKCTVYYPEIIEEIMDVGGKMGVECTGLKREYSGRIEVREFMVMRKGRERRVWHFLFNVWPDHGVPLEGKDQKALRHLVKISRSHSSPRRDSKRSVGPRVVHCSAGVGRTGTFIALDYLLPLLGEGTWEAKVRGDPVLDAVRCLREQRMRMVHRVGQFVFLYQMLREEWEVRNERLLKRRQTRSSSSKRRRHDAQGNSKGKKGFLGSVKIWLAERFEN
jgi:protein-tyrosine phosphatase